MVIDDGNGRMYFDTREFPNNLLDAVPFPALTQLFSVEDCANFFYDKHLIPLMRPKLKHVARLGVFENVNNPTGVISDIRSQAEKSFQNEFMELLKQSFEKHGMKFEKDEEWENGHILVDDVPMNVGFRGNGIFFNWDVIKEKFQALYDYMYPAPLIFPKGTKGIEFKEIADIKHFFDKYHLSLYVNPRTKRAAETGVFESASDDKTFNSMHASIYKKAEEDYVKDLVAEFAKFGYDCRIVEYARDNGNISMFVDDIPMYITGSKKTTLRFNMNGWHGGMTHKPGVIDRSPELHTTLSKIIGAEKNKNIGASIRSPDMFNSVKEFDDFLNKHNVNLKVYASDKLSKLDDKTGVLENARHETSIEDMHKASRHEAEKAFVNMIIEKFKELGLIAKFTGYETTNLGNLNPKFEIDGVPVYVDNYMIRYNFNIDTLRNNRTLYDLYQKSIGALNNPTHYTYFEDFVKDFRIRFSEKLHNVAKLGVFEGMLDEQHFDSDNIKHVNADAETAAERYFVNRIIKTFEEQGMKCKFMTASGGDYHFYVDRNGIKVPIKIDDWHIQYDFKDKDNVQYIGLALHTFYSVSEFVSHYNKHFNKKLGNPSKMGVLERIKNFKSFNR